MFINYCSFSFSLLSPSLYLYIWIAVYILKNKPNMCHPTRIYRLTYLGDGRDPVLDRMHLFSAAERAVLPLF